jgi:hypothetical protein
MVTKRFWAATGSSPRYLAFTTSRGSCFILPVGTTRTTSKTRL